MYKNFQYGFLWSAVGQYGTMVSLIVINMFLSRLLSPQEYGQVAMITVFITFFQLITEAGLGPAIIQQKDLQQKDYNSLFNISLIFSIGLAFLFGIFGYIISYFYEDISYIKFSWLLSIVVLFNGMQIVPNAIMLKNQLFKIVNLIKLAVTIVSGIVGVILAFRGFGVYTLIINSMLNASLNFILIMKFSKLKTSKSFDFKPLRKVWNFSKNQFGFNFINYFSRNSDNLLIGKFMSSDALGNYNKSYQLLMYPVTIFGGVITPVLQPILSNYQDNTMLIKEVYYKLIKVLAFITIPFSIFLMFSAKQIILVMFGNQWQAAIYSFSILSATVWIQVIGSTAGAIFQARNKTKELFLTGTLSAIILVTSIVIGVTLGSIETVSICLSLAFFWNFIQSYWFLTHKVLKSNLLEFFKLFITPICSGILMMLVFCFYSYFLDAFFQSMFINLCIRFVLFIVVFIVTALLFGEYKSLLKLIIKDDKKT
ncbi:lipopolysaccharide biosynthesis protein [Leuconostoc gelidum subsp. gasicomitatum]|uniref:lipopolysaccharide biosynthesis protein n=1 Tax=Leuconostoc gasicomitatum TaxID=115778 RepID=UPI001CC794C8|nr:lipopolysaccharide biosynthesis protein [Leuconostoc gasicomitatum]MBZ5961165.1 lipopolysaccharide biosynthesis protein [Leuconostoc gasicomitatum]MBZ5993596.1 lipopolysaccharide biosynthesis protein [Leuconostoc gasicomitatum]